MPKIGEKQKLKALFLVGSTSQAEMFDAIAKELPDWNIAVINVDRWDRRAEIEKVLQELGYLYKTIRACSKGEVQKIFTREQPDIVIVGNDTHLVNKLFVREANSSGIPTLLVQDGIMSESRAKDAETGGIGYRLKYLFSLPIRFLKFLIGKNYSLKDKIEITLFELRYGTRGRRETYGHGECQKMAIFGDATRNMFVSEGIELERIVVTGNPKFDKLFYSKDSHAKQKICERWGISQEKEIVLLATQDLVGAKIWTTEQRDGFTLAVIKAVQALPNAESIIKLHPPLEQEEDYRELVKDLAHPPIIIKYFALHELLDASSLVITVASTTGLEAMALKKPVIIMNLFNDVAPLFFKNSGALYVTREEEILTAIKSALYDPKMREEMAKITEKFVYEQAYRQDGQASRRIASLIRNMAAHKDH